MLIFIALPAVEYPHAPAPLLRRRFASRDEFMDAKAQTKGTAKIQQKINRQTADLQD